MSNGQTPSSTLFAPGSYPSQVTVINGLATRLPNAPGNGGCVIVNNDLQYSVDVSPTNNFVMDATTTIKAGLSITWPEGPVWARVTPNQSGAVSIELTILPGISSFPPAGGSTFLPLATITGAGPTIITPSPSAVQLVIVTASFDISIFVSGAASGLVLPQAGTVGFYVYALPGTSADQKQGYVVTTSGTPSSPVYVYQSVEPIVNLSLPPYSVNFEEASASSFTLAVPFGTVGLVIESGVGYPTVTDGSGGVYPAILQSVGNPTYGSGFLSVWWVSIGSASFSNYTVSFGNTGPFIICPVPVNPFLGARAPVWTIAPATPAAGNDWAYTMPFAARLVGISAQLNTSATAANRLPYFWFVSGGTVIQQVPMSPTPITAGDTLIMSGGIGMGNPFMRTGDNHATFSIPDIPLLPVGTNIQSATSALQSGDQWSNIELVFSAV